MPDYNNPAGRLLKILTDLGAGPITREALATKLGTSSDWGSIFNGLAELRKEYELLEAAVSEFGENPHKLSQYKEDLAAIKATFRKRRQLPLTRSRKSEGYATNCETRSKVRKLSTRRSRNGS